MLKHHFQEHKFKQNSVTIAKKLSNDDLYDEYVESKDSIINDENYIEKIEDETYNKLQVNMYKNRIQMKDLKFIPTEIFWIRLMLLVPLIPIISLILFPYYDLVYQFQIYWAATLLSFKCGVRWASLIIQSDNSYQQKSYIWSSCHSWKMLFSTLLPPLLAAVALQLSFPSNHIVLIYAFVKSLQDEFSMKAVMPDGYVELEIISSVIIIIFLFGIVCENVFFDLI